MLNQGLGQFHGGAYYRNSNYHNNNKYQDEVEKGDNSISDSDSENSSARNFQEKNRQETHTMKMLAIEKHKRLMERKDTDIERIEKILKVFDTIIVLLGLIGTAIAQYESNLYYENDNSPTNNSNSLRSLVH